MKIIIIFHQSRKTLAQIQYNHLRSFYKGDIHYICHNCQAPVDEPFTRVNIEQYSRQLLLDTLINHSGLVCILDCDRLIHEEFMTIIPPGTALYPRYLYYTGRPHVDFQTDLSTAKHEKLINVYKEVNSSKVPTSGTTLMYVEDWAKSKSANYFQGYGYGDVATFLDMQRNGIRFLPSNAPVLHLHHDYDMPHTEFVRQNKANAYKLSALYHLPISDQVKQLPST